MGLFSSILEPITSTVGSILGYESTRKAGSKLSDAYGKSAAIYEPFVYAGQNAVNVLTSMAGKGPGEYTASPYYDWLEKKTTRGVTNKLGSLGLKGSGAAIKTLGETSAGLAASDYQNWLNNWYKSLTPYQNLASIGVSAAGGQSAAITGQGQTEAATTIGKTNTLVNWLNDLPGWADNFSSLFGTGGGTNLNSLSGSGSTQKTNIPWWFGEGSTYI